MGERGEQGPAGSSGTALHLFDANGQDLGIFVGQDEKATWIFTFLPSSGDLLRIYAGDPKVQIDTSVNRISYSELNCQGDPFSTSVRSPSIKNQIDASVVVSGVKKYFRFITSIPAQRVSNSYRDNTGICINLDGGGRFNPTYELQEVSLPFSEPLAWPLEVREN
jgi:hypothetical protein